MSTNISALDEAESKFPNFAEGQRLPDFLRVCYSKWFWLLLGFVCMGSGFLLSADSKRTNPLVNESRPVSIEDVQLGWRVVGENPLGQETWDKEPDAASWQKVVLNLESESGSQIEVSFLRPNAWFEQWRVEVGRTIDLALSEPGKSGLAEVVSIEPCPEIMPGKGPVVTGVFRHVCEAGELVSIQVGADEAPIVCTRNHGFWSETRKGFIEAADLKVGEQFLGVDKSPVAVTSIGEVTGAKPVFNLETHNHHVYVVGEVGMLVHNMCGPDVGRDGEVVRRFDSKSKIKDLKKNGIEFDPDKGNGIPTTTTNIEPVGPDKIKELTGANNATNFADIDISGLPVNRTTTKAGVTEIRVQVDIESTRVIDVGRVRKNRQSTDD